MDACGRAAARSDFAGGTWLCAADVARQLPRCNCSGTTHAKRMKRMASVALQHPCTASGVSRIVVAQYWNLDDDVTYPAWPLLKNATYINGALHPGCRPVRSVVRFTPTVAFECLFKPSLKVGRPSTLGDRPPPPIRVAIRVAMRRAIELPYVENAFCYDEQPVVPERTTDFYFRGGLHIFGAGGKRVRHSLLLLRGGELNATIICTVHTNMRWGGPGCQPAETNKQTAAREMQRSRFCLVPRGDTPDSSRLYDAMACGCIPIIVSDKFRGAFADVVDYSRFSLRISEEEMNAKPADALRAAVQQITPAREHRMRTALRTHGASVLWLHPASALTSLVSEAILANDARAARLTQLTSWY